ncbi:hypothetical protein [uncultured Bosea sp.]|uniref:hypothetical protein n=1 Tax=uncultured Bosea sp. TaxID=211457 RepID=UPI00263B9B6C|nr:hypothetical protein [uncultured Bosea sp.]
MTKPTVAANAAGLPEDPLSHRIDNARYLVGLAADLCGAFAMACQALSDEHRRGLMAIHRDLDQRLDAAWSELDDTHGMALALETA